MTVCSAHSAGKPTSRTNGRESTSQSKKIHAGLSGRLYNWKKSAIVAQIKRVPKKTRLLPSIG